MTAVIAIGDSITYGIGITGVTETTTYPYDLEQLLGAPVINAGRGGNTTAMMSARLPPLLDSYAAPAVAILGGTNDLTTSLPAATIEANLAGMIAEVAAAGSKVVLLTIPPSADFTAPMNTVLAEANAWIAEQATGNVIVADTHAALKDPEAPTTLLAEYDSGDAKHPSAAGLAKIAETVYAAMQGAGWV